MQPEIEQSSLNTMVDLPVKQNKVCMNGNKRVRLTGKTNILCTVSFGVPRFCKVHKIMSTQMTGKWK